MAKNERAGTMGLLTVKKISRLLRTPGCYRHERNLFLDVRSETNVLWLFRYEFRGRKRWPSIGPYPSVDIKSAEFKAAEMRRQIWNDRVDPMDARAQQKAARLNSITFRDAARQYYELHRDKWRSAKHAKQFWASLETFAFPILRDDLPVSSIVLEDILRVLEQPHAAHGGQKLWHAIPKTAGMLRGRIEAVLSWAKSKGFRSGENPAAWDDNLEHNLPAISKLRKPKPHAALPYVDIPSFMGELRAREGNLERAMEILILTAVRTSEVLHATWDEIDLNNRVWTIVDHRTKTGEIHRVPLSDRCIEILRSLPREDDNAFVFVGSIQGRSLGILSFATVVKRMGRAGIITPHGFRSCFTDWAHEQTGYPKVVIDKALGHKIPDKVEAAYRRGDLIAKRTKLMAAWAAYCCSKPTAGATVVPIRPALRA
jgi:integrase